MTTMKAMRYDRYGGPEVLEYANRDKPEACAGQVLIRIRAASVNPIDWKLRSGAMKTISNSPGSACKIGVDGPRRGVGQGVDDTARERSQT